MCCTGLLILFFVFPDEVILSCLAIDMILTLILSRSSTCTKVLTASSFDLFF